MGKNFAGETDLLSGEVLQNGILRNSVTARLTAGGYNVLNPHIVPANDGGAAFGRAVIATAKNIKTGNALRSAGKQP
ncbi:hypothetical protein ABVF61_15635 [Roseibium sp. HPY-6]|uniref:Kae1-like domain-containing protein n=1 Tax=Roseibium sp. HPY-6 TaxID=3229852 RepID=UPI00338E7F86